MDKTFDGRVVIRNVSPDDAAEIAGIYSYYVEHTTVSFETEAPDEAGMRRRIVEISSSFPYFVAELDGRVIGYSCVHPWKERRAYYRTLETTVYLREGVTAHGVGRLLMERLIDACRHMADCHALIACITTENEVSRRFHESLGFEEVSHFKEVGHKFGRCLDVTDMELVL